jgi:Cys-rich repeat protein
LLEVSMKSCFMRPAAALSAFVLWAACGGNVVIDSGPGAGGGGNGGSTSTAICVGTCCTSHPEICGAGQTCDLSVGFCVYACTADSDCPQGGTCVDGACLPEETGTGGTGGGTGGCVSDSDCPTGQLCDDSMCISVPCASDADCPDGDACDANTESCVEGCLSTGACAVDTDCCSGSCVDGFCM